MVVNHHTGETGGGLTKRSPWFFYAVAGSALRITFLTGVVQWVVIRPRIISGSLGADKSTALRWNPACRGVSLSIPPILRRVKLAGRSQLSHVCTLLYIDDSKRWPRRGSVPWFCDQ